MWPERAGKGAGAGAGAGHVHLSSAAVRLSTGQKSSVILRWVLTPRTDDHHGIQAAEKGFFREPPACRTWMSRKAV